MKVIHSFLLDAEWDGGRNSTGKIEAGNLKQSISIPSSMNGPGVGTNPDEMLLGAASTCFIITYAAMLERSGIHVASLKLHSEAKVDVTANVFTFQSIHHQPTVILEPDQSVEKAEKLAQKAEQTCMISRALSGNVDVSVEPLVRIIE